MPDTDVFLTLIGPLGPLVGFDEYREYCDKPVREMSLETVLDGIRRAHAEYGRWLDDVLVVGIGYVEAHPEHRQTVLRALLDAGLDPDAWGDG